MVNKLESKEQGLMATRGPSSKKGDGKPLQNNTSMSELDVILTSSDEDNKLVL